MDEQQLNPTQPESMGPQDQPEPPQAEFPPEPQVVTPPVAPIITPSVPVAPTSPPQPQPSKPSSEGDNKLFAAISYLSILFIIPWIVKKDDKFVAFHIKQGAGLFIAEAITWVALWLVESFLVGLFSYHAASLTLWLNKLAWFVFAAFSLVGVYYALKGETKKLPYLDFVTKYIKL